MPPDIVFIASHMEETLARRIRAAAPAGIEVIHDGDLHAPPRYREDHVGRADFARTPEQEARWRAHLSRATILWDFPAKDAEGRPGITHAPNVRWVQTTSAGVGQMVARLGPLAADILVTTASGVHAGPLAEFVFMALLAHVKELDRLRAEQRQHLWKRYCAETLAGKTIAIVGAGKIGARVGRIARAFDMRAVGVVARPSPARAAEMGLDELRGQDDLREVLAHADVVVLATPHTPATDKLIDAAALAAMRPGVVLVNVARGAVVDEPALIEALRSGHVAFAALDVAAVEPLPADSPLWDMPNVLISPHSASTVAGESEAIAEIFIHNLAAWREGRLGDMRNVLDKARMY